MALDLGAARPGPRAAPSGSTPSGSPGVVDLTPGIRSLQVQVDPATCCRSAGCWRPARRGRGRAARDATSSWCPAAIVHLPLSWDDPATREAIERYMHGVRADAPWCPWNIEFIRRINGLDSRRRRAPHRVRRRVPRARARRRLPRRAGRHAARPAPPPGHHQVQPGPHLDAGERGRHRRRLPVHLRHGGPGRLPVRRPHRARCGTATARRRHVRAGQPVAAALLRPDPLLPGRRPTSCSTCAPSTAAGAAGESQIDDGSFSPRRARPVPRRATPTSIDDVPRHARQAAFGAERAALGRGGRVRRDRGKEVPHDGGRPASARVSRDRGGRPARRSGVTCAPSRRRLAGGGRAVDAARRATCRWPA